jgi:hypothetical protein
VAAVMSGGMMRCRSQKSKHDWKERNDFSKMNIGIPEINLD